MRKCDVIELFGGVGKASQALGISRQAIWKWGEKIPESAAYRVQVVSKGKLRVGEEYGGRNNG